MRVMKNPEYNLKLKYKKALELGYIGALTIMIIMFQAFRGENKWALQMEMPKIEISVEEIPPTEQPKQRPIPPRPAIPIPTTSEEIPEEETIESTELNLAEIPPPPPPMISEEESDVPMFVPYDEPPEMIGGIAALQALLEYPPLARKAGMEAKVIISVLVDEHGNSVKAKVLKDSGTKLGFEKAAIKALMQMKWKPAYQRDKPVKVWITVPVNFKLREATT